MSHGRLKPTNYGVLAEFKGSQELLEAAKKTREAGFNHLDAYTPFPVHGLAEVLEFSDVRIKWIMFLGGLTGACSGFMLQAYTNGFDYPWNIGGKPLLSLPSMVPITFECTILFAALSGAIAMFLLNGLPQPYHPVFDVPGFERASQDRFFLCVESKDPEYDEEKVIQFLKGLKPISVSVAWEEHAE